MKFLGLSLLLFLSFAGYAQGEFNPKMTPILPSPNMNASKPMLSPKTPSLFDVKPANNSIPFPEAPKSIFGEKEKFVDANKPYTDKMNKLEGSNVLLEETKKNQYYGDFKTKSTTARIQYRDFGAVDGDVIKIYVNDNIVRSSVTLTGDFSGFTLPLQPGFNKVEFEALNTGYSFPNTAEFEVYDDKGVRITANSWNLSTGFKASIIIVKE